MFRFFRTLGAIGTARFQSRGLCENQRSWQLRPTRLAWRRCLLHQNSSGFGAILSRYTEHGQLWIGRQPPPRAKSRENPAISLAAVHVFEEEGSWCQSKKIPVPRIRRTGKGGIWIRFREGLGIPANFFSTGVSLPRLFSVSQPATFRRESPD